MNPIRRIRRLAGILAGLAGAWLGLAAAAPAAFARPAPPSPPTWDHKPIPLPLIREKHPPLPVQVHTVVMGGMPGWQIALIAAGAALLAAIAAVIVYRAWAARRKTIAAAA